MFDNFDELVYWLMCEVVVDGLWVDKLKGVVCIEWFDVCYYYVLFVLLCLCVDVWCMIYYYLLCGGVDVVVEWFKGSVLWLFFVVFDVFE